MGLDPRHFSVIGKCYSTNPSVYFNLKNIQGLDLCSSSQHFLSNRSFDSQYKENVANFLEQRIEKILASGCTRLIIVDDGGELIQAVNQLIKNDIFPPSLEIVGVEQTSSGFVKLKDIDLLIPVINVARSNVKLQVESSLIADSIIKNLCVALDAIKAKPTKALVVGMGAIGSKVKEKLGLYYSVDSFDPVVEGCTIQSFEDIDFQRYNLILGCSGKEIMNFSDFHRLKKETVLVSASSSDREFCGSELRTQLNSLAQCHEHLSVNGVHLLNCGFPVNFSNDYDLVDDDRYQLTRALLLAGVFQAYSHDRLDSCFIELSASVQKAITEHFFSLYPDFCKEVLCLQH